ncbi:uncharacterized protein LOC131328469 [Rhododendron vialii]|uniref:uncharacterized protein LOC131328469 n=1 Tax=Rhododendron vialii TaxID=182163 RepID=UPI0026604B0A|nr:uncharacterized protein LOC131328469 [Rhododendron vialii]
MEKSHDILDEERGVVFISDRHREIKEGIAKVFSSSFHAYCLYDLKSNLRTCLASTNVKTGENCPVTSFLENWTNPDRVHPYCLMSAGRMFFFPGQRYGAMSSTLTECFNSWILKERELPVVDMVDLKTWKVIPSSADIFEVDTDPSVNVDIGRRTCSCCWWQLNGFPCCHAVCAIKYSGKDLNLYVERYFHIESYREVYSKPIYPVASLWKGDVVDCGTSILPPLSKKPPGRPKKKRIHLNGENIREMTCGRCGKMGNHNKLTCKADLRPDF